MTTPFIEQARANLAARYMHDYHKSAILAGEWDNGSLIAAELQKIEQGATESNTDQAGENGD